MKNSEIEENYEQTERNKKKLYNFISFIYDCFYSILVLNIFRNANPPFLITYNYSENYIVTPNQDFAY